MCWVYCSPSRVRADTGTGECEGGALLQCRRHGMHELPHHWQLLCTAVRCSCCELVLQREEAALQAYSLQAYSLQAYSLQAYSLQACSLQAYSGWLT